MVRVLPALVFPPPSPTICGLQTCFPFFYFYCPLFSLRRRKSLQSLFFATPRQSIHRFCTLRVVPAYRRMRPRPEVGCRRQRDDDRWRTPVPAPARHQPAGSVSLKTLSNQLTDRPCACSCLVEIFCCQPDVVFQSSRILFGFFLCFKLRIELFTALMPFILSDVCLFLVCLHLCNSRPRRFRFRFRFRSRRRQ